MKHKFKVLLGLLFISASAFAEGSSGSHGGEAILCYKTDEARSSVEQEYRHLGANIDLRLSLLSRRPEMVDVADAKAVTGLALAGQKVSRPRYNGRSASQVYQEIKGLDSQFFQLFKSSITRNDIWKGQTSGVFKLNDAHYHHPVGKNCIRAQVAAYVDSVDQIEYDTRIVNLMNDENREALKLHEDLYLFFRKQLEKSMLIKRSVEWARASVPEYLLNPVKRGVPDSDAVRSLVGYLFTTEKYEIDDFFNLAKRLAVSLETYEYTSNIFVPAYGCLSSYFIIRTYQGLKTSYRLEANLNKQKSQKIVSWLANSYVPSHY